MAATTTIVATTPSTTATSTTAASTTTATQSPDERRAEIEALVSDAIIGRLQAVYDRDTDALLYWVASQKEYEDGLAAMDRLSYLLRPDEDVVTVTLEEVLLDRPDCVVTRDTLSVGPEVIEGLGATSSTTIGIWWPAEDGRFQHGAVWQDGTPQVQWIEECDLARRGVTPMASGVDHGEISSVIYARTRGDPPTPTPPGVGYAMVRV